MVKSILIATLLAVGVATNTLVERQDPQQTSNDVQNGKCAPTTLIYARGTTELGNLGISVGPALVAAMKKTFGDVAVQGVNYPANFEGAITGFAEPAAANGSKNMAMFAQQVFSKCSTTKLVLSGYSQGAEQVHGALQNLGPDASKVAAVVTYGDPLQKQPFANVDQAKTKIFCDPADGVCSGMYNITAAHLSYMTVSIQPTVEFLQGVLSGKSSGSGSSSSGTSTPSSSGGGAKTSGSAATPSTSARPSQVTTSAAGDSVFFRSNTALAFLALQFGIIAFFASSVGL